MGFFRQLLGRAAGWGRSVGRPGAERTGPQAPARANAEPSVEQTPGGANAERVVERLSEDEALREDLTDDAFGPLLAAVADLVLARGSRYGSTDDLHAAARRLLAGAVEAARSADPAALLAAAESPLVDAEARGGLAAALARLPKDADAAGPAVAAALRAASGPGRSA